MMILIFSSYLTFALLFNPFLTSWQFFTIYMYENQPKKTLLLKKSGGVADNIQGREIVEDHSILV